MNRKFLRLIGILFIAVGVLAFNNYYKKEGLIKNGVAISAVIEKISANKFDNEFSPTVENIHVKYVYTVDSETYTKTQEISRHEHDLYFSKTGKTGDSIKIIYDAEKPTNSKIQKMDNKGSFSTISN
ncbi:P-loop NTPase family protein [Aquimarina sp. M1]